jgi:hypothetical protein
VSISTIECRRISVAGFCNHTLLPTNATQARHNSRIPHLGQATIAPKIAGAVRLRVANPTIRVEDTVEASPIPRIPTSPDSRARSDACPAVPSVTNPTPSTDATRRRRPNRPQPPVSFGDPTGMGVWGSVISPDNRATVQPLPRRGGVCGVIPSINGAMVQRSASHRGGPRERVADPLRTRTFRRCGFPAAARSPSKEGSVQHGSIL